MDDLCRGALEAMAASALVNELVAGGWQPIDTVPLNTWVEGRSRTGRIGEVRRSTRSRVRYHGAVIMSVRGQRTSLVTRWWRPIIERRPSAPPRTFDRMEDDWPEPDPTPLHLILVERARDPWTLYDCRGMS